MLDLLKNVIAEKTFRKSFIYTFLIGLIAHGYCFLNLLISHDSLNDFYVSAQWERAGFGRIFYTIYISLTRGRIILPWVIGLLSLLWISLAVYLIARLFQIEQAWMLLLIAGICVSNPTVYALAATYIHDLDADMFAMLLSVVAVNVWQYSAEVKEEKYVCLLGGALLLSVSLGIYQSFITLTITLVLLYCIKELLENRSIKQVLVLGCRAMGMLFMSAVLYLLELKIFEWLTGVSTMNQSSYNGLGNLSEVLSGNLLKKILQTYKNFLFRLKILY